MHRSALQPTAGKPGATQAELNVGASPAHSPQQSRAIVLKHQHDDALIEAEFTASYAAVRVRRVDRSIEATGMQQPALVLRRAFVQRSRGRKHNLRCNTSEASIAEPATVPSSGPYGTPRAA